jgi:hypothetical protein
MQCAKAIRNRTIDSCGEAAITSLDLSFVGLSPPSDINTINKEHKVSDATSVSVFR